MPETGAAHRLLTRMMTRLRENGRSPAEPLAAFALLASRLGHRKLATSLTRLALEGERITDYRISWLLYRLARECSDDAHEPRTPSRHDTAATLTAQYRRFVEAGNVDLINGAGGAGMALWDLADAAARDEFAPQLADTIAAIMRQPSNGLYHGRAGGILLMRMIGYRYGEDYGEDAVLTEAIDALVHDVERLEAASLDTGELGINGVTLCYGIPGMLAALGPAADPGVLARISHAPITRSSLARLDELLADETSDDTVCHGLAGVSLAGQLSPSWSELLGPDRTDRLATRLAAWLDQVGDEAVDAVFETPFVRSVLEGPVGVALALAETATTTLPWWGIGVNLGDATAAVAGRTTTGAAA